jgi:serine/threonine-protein kinase
MKEPSFARVKIGQELAGKYRVERVIGVGGMGIVVAARHVELDEVRAIKLLHPAELGNSQALARFTREARAAVRLRSEHAARVFDAGRLDSGVPYMILEYLEGSDLNKLCKDVGRLPITEAVLYVMQACDAVAEAHALGIIHRDLKPANLFLTHRMDGSPCIKVLDFGISKRVDGRAPSGMTRTTDIMGSPLYMSPEQMRSTKDVDARTDIWALGAILYKLLAGDAPFQAKSVADVYSGILERDPPPLSSHRNDIPEVIERIIERCLRKDREERVGSALELAAALAPFAPEEEAPRSVRTLTRTGPVSVPASLLTPAPGSVPSAYMTPLPAPAPVSCRTPLPVSTSSLVADETPTVVPGRRAPEPPAPPAPESAPPSGVERTMAAWGQTRPTPPAPWTPGPRVMAAIALCTAGLGIAIGVALGRHDAERADRDVIPRAAAARVVVTTVAAPASTPAELLVADPPEPVQPPAVKLTHPPEPVPLAYPPHTPRAERRTPGSAAADPFGRNRR